MRLKVSLHTPKLPIIYRNIFMSFIKECLRKSDSAYREKLYPEKGSPITKVVKPFCFCVRMPSQKEMKREKISIDSDFEIEDTVFSFRENSFINFLVSSCDYEFIVNLYNGILENRTFNYNRDINLTMKGIHLLKEKIINSDCVAFKTLSPILIESKDERPILPFENIDDFTKEFNSIHDRILKDIRGYGLRRLLEFEPINLKKQVVKHTLRGFREKTGKPYMTLTCFEGSFKLSGDPEDLQMLYQIGIGLRTGQGFGMVEVC